MRWVITTLEMCIPLGVPLWVGGTMHSPISLSTVCVCVCVEIACVRSSNYCCAFIKSPNERYSKGAQLHFCDRGEALSILLAFYGHICVSGSLLSIHCVQGNAIAAKTHYNITYQSPNEMILSSGIYTHTKHRDTHLWHVSRRHFKARCKTSVLVPNDQNETNHLQRRSKVEAVIVTASKSMHEQKNAHRHKECQHIA